MSQRCTPARTRLAWNIIITYKVNNAFADKNLGKWVKITSGLQIFFTHTISVKNSQCALCETFLTNLEITHSPQLIPTQIPFSFSLLWWKYTPVSTFGQGGMQIMPYTVKPDFQSVLLKSSESAATIISIQPNDIYVEVPVLVRHRRTYLCNIWFSRTFFFCCATGVPPTRTHLHMPGIWKLFQGDGWFFSWMSINFTYLKFLNHVYTTNPPNTCL